MKGIWITVDKANGTLVFSRCGFTYPNNTPDVAGPKDRKRADLIGNRDGDIVAHIPPEAWLDLDDLILMLQATNQGGPGEHG